MEWFDKLKNAKELLDSFADRGANYLRTFSEFLRQVAEATDKAAKALDPTPDQMVALGTVHQEALEGFLAECQRGSNRSSISTMEQAEAAGWKEIGLTLLIDLVSRLIEKYRQRPVPSNQ